MRKDPKHERGDELLFFILNEKDEDGEATYNLLAEFFRGYPLSKLKLLLQSNNNDSVAAGVWIASELASAAKPLLCEITPLINHPSSRVRFWTFDCLLMCAGPDDAEAISNALGLLEDTHPGVRQQAMRFLTLVPETMLEAVLCRAKKSGTEHPLSISHIKGVEMILRALNSSETSLIEREALKGSDVLLRKYATATAVRLAQQNPTLLQLVMDSEDEEVRKFARLTPT